MSIHAKGMTVLRWLRRWIPRVAALVAIVIALGLLFWMHGALYHRWVRFPEEAAAWSAIRADRQPVAFQSGWNEYRGVLHSHSLLSHDCEVSFERILEVLKETQRDFICLSDHCVNGRADFNAQWRGLHDGKLFIPGFEMKNGFMPFGAAAGTVLSNAADPSVLARQIVDSGGLLFYAHPEEPREWDRAELTGMEIYNTHADFKDKRLSPASLLPDVWLNLRRYPDQVSRLMFDRPTANLKRWDDCNRARHIVGVAGNDCHQNVGVRAFLTPDGSLRIEDTSPKKLAEKRLNFFTRSLVRMACGSLEPGRVLFQLQLDPYERMTRFVTTHILARELTESAMLESLKAGRVFMGFDMVADSTGFIWCVWDKKVEAVMGETRPLSPGLRLRAASPHACRFTVLKDGEQVGRQEGREIEYTPSEPGAYRVEAELRVCGEWMPWIYANPIWLR